MNAVSHFFHGVGRPLPRPAPLGQARPHGRRGRCFVYLLPILNPPLITTTDSDFGAVLFLCALYALVAIGLNIVIGYAGLLDLGYIGFFAIGAFTVGVLGSAHAQAAAAAVHPHRDGGHAGLRHRPRRARRCASAATTWPS